MKQAQISTREKIVNGVLFQVCWALAIFSEWYFALIALLILLVHSAVSFLSVKILSKIACLAAIGIAIDSVMMAQAVYQFDLQTFAFTTQLVPVWLCILWFGFFLTIPSSLSWLLEKPVWFIVACSIAGPISYASGRRFDALSFSDAALLIIALEWLIMGILTVCVMGAGKPKDPLPLRKSYA